MKKNYLFFSIFFITTVSIAMEPDKKTENIQFDSERSARGWQHPALTEYMVHEILATCNGRKNVVGSIEIPEHASCTFQELFVIKSMRNKGIGKSLLEQAVQHAKNSGCSEISGIIHPHHAAYYEKLGAHVQCETKKFTVPSLEEKQIQNCIARYTLPK